MKTNPTTGSVGVSWLVSKLVARQQKRQAAADANTIDNLDRLYQLKVKGGQITITSATLKNK